MAKLSGQVGFGSGFGKVHVECLTPASPNLKGGICCKGTKLSGDGKPRMDDLQGKGGLQPKKAGCVSTSASAPGAKMDNKSGKGIQAKGVGQVKTTSGGKQEKMGQQGKES